MEDIVFDNLKERALQVQNETGAGKNSANRIGDLLSDFVSAVFNEFQNVNDEVGTADKKGLKTCYLADLDSLKDTGATHIYKVKKPDESYIGILIVTEDVQLRTVSQLLISDIIPTDSNFGSQREPGRLHILTRLYNSVQLQWTKWTYYGIYDNVIADRSWWSSKKINDELLKRYKTIGFAGTVTDNLVGASTPVTGTSETVYFSTVLKCFVVKNGSSYYPNWVNAALWNDKAGTNSPVAYSDCYYINDDNQYLFNGTELELLYGKDIDALGWQILMSSGNLKIKDYLILNSYFNTDGRIYESEDFNRTPKIFVKANTQIILSGIVPVSCHTWDTNGGSHVRENIVSDNNFLVTKDYDFYVGYNFPSSLNMEDGLIIIKGGSYEVTEANKKEISTLKDSVKNLEDFQQSTLLNTDLLIEKIIIPNSYYQALTGTISASESYKRTPKIFVPKNTKIKLNSIDRMTAISTWNAETDEFVREGYVSEFVKEYDCYFGITYYSDADVSNVFIRKEGNVNQQAEDNKKAISELTVKVDDLSKTFDNVLTVKSKNLFDGKTLNGYVNSNGNFSSTSAESTYRATGYIPVKPNTYYYLSGRKELSISNIRCVDENKQNPTKVKQGSTGEENPNNWYTPGGANSQILTSETAAFIQFNLQFTTVHSDFDKVMVELVGDVYNPSFVPSAYQPYELEYKILKKALPDDIGGSSSANHHVVNLRNVPVIMLTGASHGEGYGSVKDKSFVSYLSAMLDWTVENYSLSGSDNIEHFNRIVKGQQISNVHPSNLAGGYSLIILGGNEASYYRNGVDAKYFRDNIIRLCSVIKSYGFEPVLCSYYGDMGRPWSVVLQNVADEYGYMFIDLNANGSRFYSPIYRPWWYNAHYATRTNVIQWFNILKILDNFEKPYSAVKIFRNRNTTPTDINDLLFDNRYEKMKLWRELTLHHIPLKAGYEKYVDRLDLTVYTDTGGDTVNIGATEGVESEYNSFRLGSPITIQDKALIQFTLPSVAPDIENLVLNLDTEDEVDVYVRQYVSPDLEVSLADVGGSFHLTTENPTINIGDVYADSNNAGISFTVVDYDASSKSLITVPSGSFTSEGNMTGTLTRTSGTGTQILNYDKLLDVPGESYFEKALSPKGKWVQIQKSEDSYPITGPATCMDYDRLDFLVKATSGGSFTIKDVSMEFDSNREKLYRRGKDQRCLALVAETGNQLITKTTFENAIEDWSAPEGVTIWDGQVKYNDANGTERTGNHIPTFFKTKKNVSKILRLNKGQSVSQEVKFVGEEYYCHKYKLKLVARYYPTEALNIGSLPKDVRTSQTFDFAKIGVSFKIYNDELFTKEIYVPLNFVEIEQDIVFDASIGRENNILTITAFDDNVELILCELYE